LGEQEWLPELEVRIYRSEALSTTNLAIWFYLESKM